MFFVVKIDFHLFLSITLLKTLAYAIIFLILLGHEAHRDGVVTGDNALETRKAVFGHTEMAIRMANDNRYTNTMQDLLSMQNENVLKKT